MRNKIYLNFFIIISSFFLLNFSYGENTKDYTVNFSDSLYPEERKIAYNYFYDSNAIEAFKLQENQIGIDLFDIDGDGQKEILCYIKNQEFCGSSGCQFHILKKTYDQDGKEKYIKFTWKESLASKTIPLMLQGQVKILNSTNQNVNDLSIKRKGENLSIWHWKENSYIKEKN